MHVARIVSVTYHLASSSASTKCQYFSFSHWVIEGGGVLRSWYNLNLMNKGLIFGWCSVFSPGGDSDNNYVMLEFGKASTWYVTIP